MPSVRVLPLDKDFTLELGPAFEPSEALSVEIDAIWEQEKARRGTDLSDGPAYSLMSYHQRRLSIRSIRYKHIVARRYDPRLAAWGLAVRPLAVAGVVTCPQGLVLGRRGGRVTSDAGTWEPAPSGVLSQPNPRVQVLAELREELGLEPSRVGAPEARGLVEDVESGVLDIVFRMGTEASSEEIEVCQQRLESPEHTALAFVALKDLGSFLRANQGSLLPTLRAMLDLAGPL